MRNHGFRYVDPSEVKVDDWVVTQFRELGQTARQPDKASQVRRIRKVEYATLPDTYQFDLDDGQTYTVEETSQVPVTDGPS